MQNVLRLVFFVLFPVPFSSICAVDWISVFVFIILREYDYFISKQ